METLLMVVTVITLGLAIGMSGLAWRLLRENRRRSQARVEALQAMAAETEVETAPRYAMLEDEDRDAWDLEIEPEPAPVKPALRPAARPPVRVAKPRRPLAPEPEVTFGATVAAPTGAPPRRYLALAVVGLAMAAVVSGIYAMYRPVIAADSAAATEQLSTRAAGGPKPLELLSLRHSIGADGAFTVTGLVQNPAEGQPARKILAVVYLFDRDGNYFAGGKASLDFSVLQPGDESPFVVHVPNVGRVSRYRVGFRSEEGGIVAHVDHRGQLPGGTTGDALDAPAVQHSVAPRRSEGRP